MIEHVDESAVEFAADIRKGLNAKQKYIPSKYFYDARGDKLFQKIMEMPEYYLTRAELEIFHEQKGKIVESLNFTSGFDIVELGAGDGTKTKILLEFLSERNIDFRYLPIDISKNVLMELKNDIQCCEVIPIHNTYLDGYQKAIEQCDRPTLTMFLGSNIGNFMPEAAKMFLQELLLKAGKEDEFFIGIDLRKEPEKIIGAYNDKAGITARFNLNLLTRINNEFHANFNVKNFTHFPVYDPSSGSTKSYLVSKSDHYVEIQDLGMTVPFKKGEPIFTEISQKYYQEEISEMITDSGFHIKETFTDKKGNFADILITKQEAG